MERSNEDNRSSKKPRSSKEEYSSADLRTWANPATDLRSELTGAARGTKAAVARVLTILRRRGELVDDRLGSKAEQMLLTNATLTHGDHDRIYGTVVQRIKLNETYTLEYVHPCAYFYYLSIISDAFCEFFNRLLDSQGARPLNVLVYGDEMTPGNPLRPDSGRESWQWSFSIFEFPNHLLHSHTGWIHITTLRASILKKVTGGVPLLAKSILKILFINSNNLCTGFYIKSRSGGMRPAKAKLFGFIADEKGLK